MSGAPALRVARPGLRPPRLYTIADVDALGAEAVPPAVAAMAATGVRWIQLRLKNADDRLRWRLALECLEVLRGTPARLWIDDRADLAALLSQQGVELGVHLGQADLPPAAARTVVGPEMPIGRSCHDAAQVEEADLDPAVDVVAIGPVFETRSKENPEPAVGLEGVAAARRRTRKPLVAIGGLDGANAPAVLAAGADTAVMLGAACHGDVEANCRRLTALLEDSV